MIRVTTTKQILRSFVVFVLSIAGCLESEAPLPAAKSISSSDPDAPYVKEQGMVGGVPDQPP